MSSQTLLQNISYNLDCFFTILGINNDNNDNDDNADFCKDFQLVFSSIVKTSVVFFCYVDKAIC